MAILKQKQTTRNAKLAPPGRTASTSSYYRPVRSNPTKSIKLKDNKTDKQSKSSNFTISRLINSLIVASFIGLLFFATTLSSKPDVKITKDSFGYRSLSEYQKISGDVLNQNPLNRSKIFFKSSDFEQKMRQEFPEIDKVEAIVPLGGRDLTVSMHLSTPLAVVYSGDKNGVLDSSGVLVTDKVPNQQELLRVRFATPQDNFKVGSRLLTTKEVEQLNLLNYELSSMTLGSDKKPLVITEALFNINDGQIEVRLRDMPYFIKLSTYADAREQVGAVKSILMKLDREGITPSSYIDVRVPGRVFVV